MKLTISDSANSSKLNPGVASYRYVIYKKIANKILTKNIMANGPRDLRSNISCSTSAVATLLNASAHKKGESMVIVIKAPSGFPR